MLVFDQVPVAVATSFPKESLSSPSMNTMLLPRLVTVAEAQMKSPIEVLAQKLVVIEIVTHNALTASDAARPIVSSKSVIATPP